MIKTINTFVLFMISIFSLSTFANTSIADYCNEPSLRGEVIGAVRSAIGEEPDFNDTVVGNRYKTLVESLKGVLLKSSYSNAPEWSVTLFSSTIVHDDQSKKFIESCEFFVSIPLSVRFSGGMTKGGIGSSFNLLVSVDDQGSKSVVEAQLSIAE